MKTVHIIDGNPQYHRLFRNLGYDVVGLPDYAKLLCFTGGEDVTPAIYGDRAHESTFNSKQRDIFESEIFDTFVGKVPMVGICRGGQFLNVMNKGRMYQNVDRHGGDHEITDVRTNKKLLVSSTHHQMLMPGPGARLIAYAELKGRREWYTGQKFEEDISDKDIEVVLYPVTKCLCFQPHPEFESGRYTAMQDYFKELLESLL